MLSSALLLGLLSAASFAAPVSYQSVLDNPDDPAVNLAFARDRAEAGELLTALAALERVLAVSPGNVQARLLYAALLARLGRMEEAGRELSELERPTLPLAVREAARRVRARLRPVRRLALDAALGVGGEWSSNANYATRSGRSLFFGVPLDLSASARRREDSALVSFARVDGRRALGRRGRAALLGGYSYFRTDRRGLPSRDLQGISLNAGAAVRGRLVVSAQGLFDHLTVDRDTFLRAPGAVLRVEGRPSARVGAWIEGRGVYEDFARPSAAPAGPERRGPRWEAALGGSFGTSPGLRFEGGYRRVWKLADARINAFVGDGLDAAFAWESAAGAFARISGGLDWDRYLAPDPFVSRDGRRDAVKRWGFAAGSSLGLLLPSLAAVSLTSSFERLDASSSLLNYAFVEDRASVVCAWRWSLR